jgi:flagellar biosynthesis protein FlhB
MTSAAMADDRTEEPTPKRLREARERGQVPRSRELGTALLLLATGAALGSVGPAWAAAFRALYEPVLTAARGELATSPAGWLGVAAARGAQELAPVLAALVVVAFLASFVQTGPLVATKAIGLEASRLDPIAGAKRMVGPDAWIELLRSVLKVVIVAWVVWGVLEGAMRGAITLAGRDAAAILAALGEILRALLFRTGGAMLAVAIGDVLYQRWRHMRELRMTRQEVEREHKDAEGDPHAKAERDRVRREVAQHDTAEAVRRASVVVVNPTHLAVALRFDEESEQAAPEVVAKGMDEQAARIRRLAEEAGVPIVRDVPLARGLFELELGEEIPERLYEAVAAVLHVASSELDPTRGER